MVAWAKDQGAGWFLDAVSGRLAEVHLVVGMNERGTSIEALLRLLPVIDSLHVFFKHRRQTFHPKIYWFEHGEDWEASTAIIGSANMTRGGLITNFEASLVALIETGSATAEEQALLEGRRRRHRACSEPIRDSARERKGHILDARAGEGASPDYRVVITPDCA
jgi:hypothetical protein